MLTKKQEQGIKILESIVQSEYPFVVSLSKSDRYRLDEYATTMGIKLEIDPTTLSKFVGLPFAKKFKETPSIWDYYMRDRDLSYILHLFEDEHQHVLGWQFNKGMDDFISKAYSQLPTNMRVNIYSDSPDYDIPYWARRTLHSPRSLTIDRFFLAPDSKPPKFED
jgi:PleD family two-component response regulator